jgi:hypothetical protein
MSYATQANGQQSSDYISHVLTEVYKLCFVWAFGQVCAINHMTELSGASQHCRGMLKTHECP